MPETERPKVYRTARIWLAIYAVAIGLAIGFGTWLPVVLIGGPRVYGTFMLHRLRADPARRAWARTCSTTG